MRGFKTAGNAICPLSKHNFENYDNLNKANR